MNRFNLGFIELPISASFFTSGVYKVKLTKIEKSQIRYAANTVMYSCGAEEDLSSNGEILNVNGIR